MIDWLKKNLIGIGCCGGFALILGISSEALIRHRVTSQYPVMGKLVDIGGRKLQLDCRGAGAPTVVLESGLDSIGSLDWQAVHNPLAQTTRTCAYSRAGILWSDPSPDRFESSHVAKDLHTALINSGEQPPWVMVGDSIGGTYAIQFTQRYDSEVAGIVLLDATHPEHFQRRQAKLGETGKSLPFGEILASSLAGTGIVRFMPVSVPAKAAPIVAEIDRAYRPQSIAAVLTEMLAVDDTLAAAASYRQLGNRPLVVLTAMGPLPPELSSRERQRRSRRRIVKLELQQDLATWSTNSRHEILTDSSHTIPFDRPDAVIRAVNEVVHKLRNHQK